MIQKRFESFKINFKEIGRRIVKSNSNAFPRLVSTFWKYNVQLYIKFIYSEKATKFCEISTILLSYAVPVKSQVDISQNFVAFLEYMNFTYKNARHIHRSQMWHIYSYGYLMISLSVLKKDALFFRSRPVGSGGPRVPWCGRGIDELNLFEPGGGSDYAYHITKSSPWIFRPSYDPVESGR